MYNYFMEKTAPAITIHIELNREAIRKTLADRAGEAPDADAVAEAVIGTWLQMSGLLAPVIGARGVDVIFRRSLYLTTTSFPWLGIIGNQGTSAVLLASLKLCLTEHSADEATEAGYTFLTIFTELLETLIGESLSLNILCPVWTLQSPASGLEAR